MLRKQLAFSICSIQITCVTLLLTSTVAVMPSQAQTFTVVHEFTGPPDGAFPNPIIRDAHGNIYGTTLAGGLASCGGGCGTVFKIDSAGNETILFAFPGGNDGANPVAGLVRDGSGNLYGTARGNGYINAASVVFKVDTAGQETVLYIAYTRDASALDSPLALDSQGNIYGMAPYGGTICGWNSNGASCGTLFKLTPSGKFSVLHKFKGTDGVQPEGGVVLDAQGNIYGTSVHGGHRKCDYPGWGQPRGEGCGTVYKLDTHGNFTVLHTFTGPHDGSYPLGLILDSAGNLYGIAESGGDITGEYIYGLGTVFEIDASGKFSVLFTFTPETTINYVYGSHLLRDTKGNLYGLQQQNNCAGGGCLFRIDPQGQYADLFNFEGEGESDDGFNPANVVFGSDDDMYGAMQLGGDGNGCEQSCGTVFHLAPF